MPLPDITLQENIPLSQAMNGDLPRECISGAPGAHIQENTMTPLDTLGAAAKLALLIVLRQGVAVQAADIKVLSAGAACQPQRALNGRHSVLKFAPQSTRGEGRVLHVGGTRGSTLLVRVEDVVLRLHGHMARVSAV
jgi:hypothetical protein